jgi:demethylmenaquinone methyltransferase / 2-methoxy-6-polyprenyl-1,4-benzoquinol methylase
MEQAERGALRADRNAAHFEPAVDNVFERIAWRYDVLCDLFSLGIHRLWKRRVAVLLAGYEWRSMIDAAAGTGDIALRLLQRAPQLAERSIVVSDLSPAMLQVAERKATARGLSLDFRVLDAHAMPSIPDASVDLYAISLALKICDRTRVMREAYRLLRPGGRFVALEASAIRWPWLHALYLGYMGACMPVIGWLATGGDASAYRYLLEGVREFPDAERLAGELELAGFEDVAFERLTLGIVAIHSARKPVGRA